MRYSININDAFFEVITEGGCVIDTASMSAYLTPQFLMQKKVMRSVQSSGWETRRNFLTVFSGSDL